MRMAELVFGADFVDQNTVMISLVNCNSPLVWDETMLGALKGTRANQAVIVARSCWPAPTRRLRHGRARAAERRGARRHRVRPALPAGAPMIYGHFLAAVSMKSGAPWPGRPSSPS